MCCTGDRKPVRRDVPRIIHQIWVGSPVPVEYLQLARRWERLHPGWEHRWWGDEELSYLDMRNRSVYDRADMLTDDAHHAGQLRSDVARYEILRSYGGVYVDCDTVPLRNIGPLVEHVSLGFAWETDGQWVGNGVIAAVPHDPVLGVIVEGLAEHVDAADPAWRPNRLTGPQYVTPILKANRVRVSLWPSSTFYPVRWDAIDDLHDRPITAAEFPGSYGVHVWANTHRRDDRSLPEAVGG